MAVCYLCAYMRQEIPLRTDPFPDESDVGVSEALGTCRKCAVWACRLHGTRYSSTASFECAMCTPAQAVKSAVRVDDDQVAVAKAMRVSAGPGSQEARRYFEALRRIQSSDRRAGLIRDFEGVMPYNADRRRPYGVSDDYPPAIAAAIQTAFTERELDLRPDAGEILSGAVSLAYAVADPDGGGRRPRPWNVPYPQLIDPIISFIEFAAG